jgi:hypothetical protein
MVAIVSSVITKIFNPSNYWIGELQLYQSSLPQLTVWGPSDLSELGQDDPLGLLQDVPSALIRNLKIPYYSRDTIIAIMELDWYCTDMLEMRQQC